MIKLIELLNEDEIEEYDVENADDIKEFIEFMESMLFNIISLNSKIISTNFIK